MLSVKVEFDPEKDFVNQEKHGVSLAFGAQVLADDRRLDILDVRFDYTEERFVSYGMVEGRACVFTLRGDVHRMISVRKANDRETRRYQQSPR